LKWTAPTPVLCIDATDLAEEALPTIGSWIHTFRSARPCVAEVVSPAEFEARAPGATDVSHVRQYVGKLRAAGFDPQWTVTFDEDPRAGLLRMAARIAEQLLVTPTNRWTDGHVHWRSVTRQPVHRWPAPVLVVPARRDGPATRLADVDARLTSLPT
jgi:hypothetical protein